MFQNTLALLQKKNKAHTPDYPVIIPWKTANNTLLNVVAVWHELLLHLHNLHSAEWLTAIVVIACNEEGLLSRMSFFFFMFYVIIPNKKVMTFI